MNKFSFTNQKILVTGAAGFIGFFLSKRLLEEGANVYGVDNLNDYYDVALKQSRLSILKNYPHFTFLKIDISNKDALSETFASFRPDYVVNLAAQAGVRYSIDHPDVYIQSNLIGFFNILELCRKFQPKHLIFASSSSVYGANTKVPFSTDDKTDRPVSLYAATKKSDELLAYAYSSLYAIPSTGLRFFTVYGPYGRPDMAYFKFADRIMRNEKIQVYNHGDMLRDFTYIDDIIEGIIRVIPILPKQETGEKALFKVYNIGGGQPEKLMTMIDVLQKVLHKKANIEFLDMQPGDVYETFADSKEFEQVFGFTPEINMERGLALFGKWYLKDRIS
jgi:Nucleoside-diphosphate-sugar epimerases